MRIKIFQVLKHFDCKHIGNAITEVNQCTTLEFEWDGEIRDEIELGILEEAHL